MKKILTVACSFLVVSLYGTTYYVATNGVNGNTGLTTDSPWPLAFALSSSASNDTIIVLPGTYNGHWATSKPSQLITSQQKWKAVLVDDSLTLPVFSFWPTNGFSTTLNGFQIYGSLSPL